MVNEAEVMSFPFDTTPAAVGEWKSEIGLTGGQSTECDAVVAFGQPAAPVVDLDPSEHTKYAELAALTVEASKAAS